MKFAFPNGIPKHHSQINITKQKLKELDLNQCLDNGHQLYLNTPPNSTINSLNNTKVFVIERTPNGIWVVHPQNNIQDSRFQYLNYKDKSIPTFSGISNIQPLEHTLNKDEYQQFYDVFNEHPKTCDIEYKGDLVKFLPEDNSIIFPDKYKHLTYSPQTDSLVNLNTDLDHNDNDLDHNDNDLDHNDNDLDQSHNDLETNNMCLSGGGKSKNKADNLNNISEEENDILELYKKDELETSLRYRK